MAKKESWEIVLTRPAEKVYDKVSGDMRHRIDSCFEDLEKNPWHSKNVRAMTGELKGLYRYRIGDWRIIYRISKEKQIVEIIAVLRRGDAY